MFKMHSYAPALLLAAIAVACSCFAQGIEVEAEAITVGDAGTRIEGGVVSLPTADGLLLSADVINELDHGQTYDLVGNVVVSSAHAVVATDWAIYDARLETVTARELRVEGTHGKSLGYVTFACRSNVLSMSGRELGTYTSAASDYRYGAYNYYCVGNYVRRWHRPPHLP